MIGLILLNDRNMIARERRGWPPTAERDGEDELKEYLRFLTGVKPKPVVAVSSKG